MSKKEERVVRGKGRERRRETGEEKEGRKRGKDTMSEGTEDVQCEAHLCATPSCGLGIQSRMSKLRIRRMRGMSEGKRFAREGEKPLSNQMLLLCCREPALPQA